jgi:hypothetical protein
MQLLNAGLSWVQALRDMVSATPCRFSCVSDSLQIRPDMVKQIALKIVSAALAADKPAAACSSQQVTLHAAAAAAAGKAAAPSALLHASSGQLRNLLRELQKLKRPSAVNPVNPLAQLCADQPPPQPSQKQPQQQQQVVQGGPEPAELGLMLPMQNPQQPQLRSQLSRAQDQQLLSTQQPHGRLCWHTDSLPGFAVSAFDTETDAYLIPVSHISKLIESNGLHQA